MRPLKPKIPDFSKPPARPLSTLRVALFSLLSTACAHKAPVYNGPISETYDKRSGRTESVLIEGDPDFGEVVHIREIHNHTDIWDPADRLSISKYQGKILRELLEIQPKTILSESMYYSNEGKETAFGCHLTESGEDLDCFFDAVNDSLTPEKKAVLDLIKDPAGLLFLTDDEQSILDKMLLSLGADIVYGYLVGFRNIKWIMADTVQDRDDFTHYKKLVENLEDDLDPKSLAKLLKQSIKANKRRESAISKHALDYLSKYPGSSIYMTCGVGHDFFDDYSKSGQQPHFREVVFESNLLDPNKRGNDQLFGSLTAYIQ